MLPYNSIRLRSLGLATGLALSLNLYCQEFYFGNDLSYANMMEDCGAVFKEEGVVKDVYQIFADHGCNLVRVRLWKDPDWQHSLQQPDGVKMQYNDFEDARESIIRSKAAGMQVMLDMHFSDFWADPGKQIIPSAWVDVADNTALLGDSVYHYVVRILTDLGRDGLMPEIIKVGNENNSGILKHTTLNPDWSAGGSVSNSWSRHAVLYNRAIQAIRDVADTSPVQPKIALHCAGLDIAQWWYQNIINNGVTDFDIIGLSYYYAWHAGSIQTMGNTIRSLNNAHPGYEVMIVEMGYLWTTQNHDSLGNIVTIPDPDYLPVIPEKQLEYLVDYTREVMKAGGTGVVFWEPAWVSTPCRNPWGIGSSHDHLVFFDPVNNNFMSNGGGRWCEPRFYVDLEAQKVSFKLDMTGQDASNGVYISGTWTGDPMTIQPMASEGNGIYSFFTFLSPGDSGYFYFMNDSSWDALEPVPAACIDPVDSARPYVIGQTGMEYAYRWGTCQPAGTPEEVNVIFRVKMEDGADLSRGVYIVGEINDWEITRMDPEGDNIFSSSYKLTPGPDTLGYYYLTTGTWTNYQDYREDVPDECALRWGLDRGIVVPVYDTIVGHLWGSCEVIDFSTGMVNVRHSLDKDVLVYPNPARDDLFLSLSDSREFITADLYELSGKEIHTDISYTGPTGIRVDVHNLQDGLYIIKIRQREATTVRKLVIIR